MHDNNYDDEQAISRRGFIKGAALTALAAGAAGAGAAAFKNQTAQTVITSAPVIPPTPIASPIQPATAAQSADLVGQLAQAHAENTRLQTQLSMLQQQLNAVQTNSTSEQLNSEALSVQLGHANERLGLFAGLLALYEQLDEVQLGERVENGIEAVATTITDMLDDLPGLEEGIQLGQVALDDFEAQLPLLVHGRLWLNQHIHHLRQRFGALEAILSVTVERAGNFLELLQEWFASVRKWLPFNLGENAAAVMQTITDLLVETPNTVNGLVTNLADPLDMFLSSDGQEHPVQQKMVRPLRDNLIAKGSATLGKARRVNDAYTVELAEPVQTAVEQQRAIKQMIAQYREQHRL